MLFVKMDSLAELLAMGISGKSVLVHTSLRAVGNSDAATYIADWIEAVGPGGLCLFPSFTGAPTDHPERPPRFDVLHSMPRRIGVTPQVVYKLDGATRSLHATHSVTGFGIAAADFLADHFDSYTPCDANSPFFKLASAGGFIALVGCTHDSNTSIHMVEEIAEVPYHLIPGDGTSIVVDREGFELSQLSRFHSWATERDFMVIDRELTRLGIQTFHSLGNAIVRLVDAEKLREWLVPILAKDPYYLAKKI